MGDLSLIRLSRDLQCYAASEPSAQYLELKFIFLEVFETDTYKKDVLAIPDNGVVLDIGANVGLFTILVKCLKKQATVLAFEPMPITFSALNKNIELHDLGGVTAYSVALGAIEEIDVEFTYFPFAPGNSTRYPQQRNPLIARDATRYKVPVTTISYALSQRPDISRIDLVKIDIEGGEAEVLRGLLPSDWSKIQSFVVEVEDDGTGGVLDHLQETFEDHRYSVSVNPHPMIPSGGPLFIVHAVRE